MFCLYERVYCALVDTQRLNKPPNVVGYRCCLMEKGIIGSGLQKGTRLLNPATPVRSLEGLLSHSGLNGWSRILEGAERMR